MSNYFERGLLLYSQSRFDLAKGSLRQAIAADPRHSRAHATLGLCFAELEKYEQATHAAEEAIRLAPDDWFVHHAMAHVLRRRNRLGEALTAAREAVRLNPHDSTSWGTLALIEHRRARWSEALSAAESGLQIDPEDDRCVNIRAMALVKLGRVAEAGATMDAALAQEPENALTQTNQGWVMLEKGNHRQAREHFREALRLHPTYDYARAGMVAVLKARNPVYRVLLNYFLWTSKLSVGMRWGLFIGLYVGFRIIHGVARQNPELAPFLMPLVIAYIVFALSTWMADPIFNLLLRINKFGRYLLSHDAIRAANFAGACILAAAAALIVGLATDSVAALLAALSIALLIIPVAAVYRCDSGWPRRAMGTIAGLLAVLILAGVAGTLAGLSAAVAFFAVSILGSMLSSWAANVLISATVKH
jgi:tetratricopeptide (TPR) repeat protein